MDFGTGVREVIGIHFSQQHRAFDSLGLWQLRGFSFGELKQGPTEAASFRVPVAPLPILDELPSTLHALVIDHIGAYLSRRKGRRDFPRKLSSQAWPMLARSASTATVPARVTAELLGQGAFVSPATVESKIYGAAM